jgi:hypothetical protein
MGTIRTADPGPGPWREHELVRRRRIRADAARPLAVNLAQGLALSEYLSRFTGAARRQR